MRRRRGSGQEAVQAQQAVREGQMNPDRTKRPDDKHHDDGWDITDYELDADFDDFNDK